jgi:hypothetical protein
MKKIVNINGIKMVMDEDGNLSKLPDKYYDVNEMRSNNLAFKRPVKRPQAKVVGELFTAINDKSGGKCNKVTRVSMNKETLQILNDNPSIQTALYNEYGIHGVEHVMNPDIKTGCVYIHYADMRYTVVQVDTPATNSQIEEIKHFAERLINGEINVKGPKRCKK